jgi:hypothetical protein
LWIGEAQCMGTDQEFRGANGCFEMFGRIMAGWCKEPISSRAMRIGDEIPVTHARCTIAAPIQPDE